MNFLFRFQGGLYGITATHGKKTIVGVKSENMIILLPVEKDDQNLKQHICRMGQEIVNRITQEIKGISVMLGIGRFYMDPADLYKSYQDATYYNTVLYRIQRIQEIVGINLDDPRDRLNMEMALRVQKVIGR
jgi:sugar diacid utilization regulator